MKMDLNYSELSNRSFRSDQASIADWVELFKQNETQIPIESDAIFKLINTENLQPQTVPVALAEEDSRNGELNKAFIWEHSEIIKGSLPLELDQLFVTP